MSPAALEFIPSTAMTKPKAEDFTSAAPHSVIRMNPGAEEFIPHTIGMNQTVVAIVEEPMPQSCQMSSDSSHCDLHLSKGLATANWLPLDPSATVGRCSHFNPAAQDFCPAALWQNSFLAF